MNIKICISAICCLALTSISGAQTLPDDSLLFVHTTEEYHTDQGTIGAVSGLKSQFRGLYALTQFGTDHPGWYGPRPHSLQPWQHLLSVESQAGEHSLQPFPTKNSFKVTVVGGYHSACLGRALAQLIANFLQVTRAETLNIHLPLVGIYSGFTRIDGLLEPTTPFWESVLDESIDGLNYRQVTEDFDDDEFHEFMTATIDLVFAKSPLRSIDLKRVKTAIYRSGRRLDSNRKPRQSREIRFYYQ